MAGRKPTKSELEKLLPKHSLREIGEMYGVTGDTIRYRANAFGLATRKVFDPKTKCGTITGYFLYGCRCELCRVAQKNYNRAKRKKR